MPLPRIVVVPPTFAEIAELARTLAPSGFELVIVRNEHTELEAALATAEYLVCYPNVRTGDAFYRAAPSLRLHQLLSAGYDDVDLEAARRAKVPVSNNGGANAISVAEHAMMLMLMVSRRVISQHANVSGGRWRGNGPAPRMYEIHGKTLGIIGLGTIGKKVARLANAFRMRVQYYDIARLPQALIASGHETDNARAVEVGLHTLGWLVKIQTAPQEHFRPIGCHGFYRKGGERARFDQQPIEANATVSACLEAYRVTQDPAWMNEARSAFEWFLGRNDLGQDLYDPGSGGCRDGLQEDRINRNQGAESTLAFLLSLAEMNLLESSLAAFRQAR